MFMKDKAYKVSSLASVVLLLLFAAGCTTSKYGAFEPNCELAPSSPDAYASYDKAMAHYDGYQMAYEWQRANPKLVEDATKREVLAAFVASPEAADALLSRIGTSYDGDPLALTQVAAVTQLVMCPKCPKAPACRKLWVAALERARDASDDGYVKVFCDQQLRLCK